MASSGKVIKWDYDFISSSGTEETPVCLSEQERLIILAMLEYVGWSRRWYSPSDLEVVPDQLQEWRDNLAYKLMGVCDVDCAEVWECLVGTGTPPADLEAWLLAQLTSNGDIINVVNNPPSTVPSPVVSENMLDGCDLDQIFAFCLQLVQWANTAVTDAYQIMELITDQIEFGQLVLKEVPYLAEATEFVAYLQETIDEAYQAAYTSDLENEYACALFCLAQEDEVDCTLTWEQCYEYFLDRLGAGLANKSIIDLLTFIGGGGWSGTEFCDASLAAFCGVMHYGGEWFGLTLEGIQKFWDSWLNDSNSDWSILCPCGWSFTETFASDLGVFYLHDYGASWSTATRGQWGVGGFVIDTYNEYIPNGNTRRGTSIEITFTGSTNLTKVRLNYNALVAGGTPISRVHVYNGASEVYLKEWNTANTGEGEAEINCLMDVTATKIWIDVVCGLESDGEIPSGSNNIPFVVLQGTGSMPAPLS